MTTDEIKAEIEKQLAVLLDFGYVKVVFGWPDEPVAEGGIRLQTDGDIPLDFTVTRVAEDAFTVYVNRIGNFATLNELPQLAVLGTCRLADSIFLPGDKFQRDYQSVPELPGNYSLYTELCQLLKPQSIMEIGVRAGYSAWAMLSASPHALYRGLDLDQGTDGGAIGYSEHAKQMLPAHFPEADIRVVYGDSQTLERLPRTYDLIHVDGTHGHDGALHDLEVCAPYAKHLLIDDVVHIATVGSAVSEFLERHAIPAWLFQTWRGHVLMDTESIKPTVSMSSANPPWFLDLS